jgi:Arc/MetJ family transcription regulator
MRFVKTEIDIDQTLLDEVMHRYHMRSPREAVNLALRSLLTVDAEVDADEDDNDPFNLAALDPHRARDAG